MKQGAGKILRFYTLCFKEDTLFLLTDMLRKKKKKSSTFNSILQVAGFATGHSVIPQFLARKDYCECQTCLAFSQV